MKQTIRLRQSTAAALLVLLTASPLLAATSSSSARSTAAKAPKAQTRVVRKVTRKTTTKTSKSASQAKPKQGFRYSSTAPQDATEAEVDETMTDPEAMLAEHDAKVEAEAAAQAESKAPARAASRTTLKSSRKGGTSTVLATEGAQRVRRAVKSKVEDRVGIQAPSFGDYTFTAQLKNTLTAGRKYELEEIGGRNYFLKNELVLGVKHKSGWGLSVAEDIRQTSNNADTPDKSARAADASVIVGHPALYKSDSLSVGGQLRAYLPTTEGSQKSGFRQLRYYSFADFTMPEKWGLSHLLMPIYMTSDKMGDTDADWLVYESLELTHQTAKTVRFGFGQQTQWEHHMGTPAGTTVEVYPFVDIEWIPNVLIEPKLYMPVFVNGLVDGAPGIVAMSQIQAELFVKIGF